MPRGELENWKTLEWEEAVEKLELMTGVLEREVEGFRDLARYVRNSPFDYKPKLNQYSSGLNEIVVVEKPTPEERKLDSNQQTLRKYAPWLDEIKERKFWSYGSEGELV